MGSEREKLKQFITLGTRTEIQDLTLKQILKYSHSYEWIPQKSSFQVVARDPGLSLTPLHGICEDFFHL